MAIDNGYIRIYMPEHKSADNNGLVYEHQLVAEQKIGRLLREEEVVHHIDRDRSNNTPDNLLIFASNADHAAFHQHEEYTLDENGIAHCDLRNKENHKCPHCGTYIDRDAKHCTEYANFLRRKVFNRPSRNELKMLVRTYSFSRIAAMYGVSDSAIRKWCEQENLPRQSFVIKNMTDEEWALI